VLHPAFPPVGPDGIDKIAPAFFTLPNERVFCALAKHNGKIEKAGVYRELFLNNRSELFLGPNEDAGGKDGPGFADNTGSWFYKILVPQERETPDMIILQGTDSKWHDIGSGKFSLEVTG